MEIGSDLGDAEVDDGIFSGEAGFAGLGEGDELVEPILNGVLGSDPGAAEPDYVTPDSTGCFFGERLFDNDGPDHPG